MDYAIGEFIYMLPSDMNLWIGNVRNYNNKILISSPSFKIGTNAKINIDVKSKEIEMVKTKPDVKPMVKTKSNVEPNKEHKQGVKPNIEFDKEHKPITDSNREHKSNTEFDKEHKQGVKEPDTDKVTYEEEKVALILGTTAVFTVWWMFKRLTYSLSLS